MKSLTIANVHSMHGLTHSFITEIYIAPLQGYYSEAFPTLARLKRTILRLEAFLFYYFYFYFQKYYYCVVFIIIFFR